MNSLMETSAGVAVVNVALLITLLTVYAKVYKSTRAIYPQKYEPGPTPAKSLPEDKISIPVRALAHTTGFLTTIFNIEVPIFILLVIAAAEDNVVIASSQLDVLNTIWSFTPK